MDESFKRISNLHEQLSALEKQLQTTDDLDKTLAEISELEEIYNKELELLDKEWIVINVDGENEETIIIPRTRRSLDEISWTLHDMRNMWSIVVEIKVENIREYNQYQRKVMKGANVDIVTKKIKTISEERGKKRTSMIIRNDKNLEKFNHESSVE